MIAKTAPDSDASGRALVQTPQQRRLMTELRDTLKSRGIRLRPAGLTLGCSAATLSREISGIIGLPSRREARVRRYLQELRGPDGLQEAAVAWVRGLEGPQLELLLQIVQYTQRIEQDGRGE